LPAIQLLLAAFWCGLGRSERIFGEVILPTNQVVEAPLVTQLFPVLFEHDRFLRTKPVVLKQPPVSMVKNT
jgi:hypothetical protein